MKEKIEKTLAELSERLENANKELSTCPEGTLSCKKRRNRDFFPNYKFWRKTFTEKHK